MIVGIGCDIVEHSLTSELGWDSKPEMLSRVFSEIEKQEIKASQITQFISGRFAAKEAILKCLGTVMEDGIALTDIQIIQADNGKPVAILNGKIKDIAATLGIISLQISISHSRGYSMAFALAERRD